MTSRAKLSIIALLSCCALVGMGFANWVIAEQPVSRSVGGTFRADPVLELSDCVTAQGAEGLAYNENGFGDPLDLYRGTLRFSCTLDMAKIEEKLGEDAETVSVAVSLSYNHSPASGDLFADGAEHHFLSAELDSDPLDGGSIDSSKTEGGAFVVICSFPFSGTEQISFTVVYTFSFGIAENFKTYFYDPFTADEELQFKLDVTELTIAGGKA